MKNSELWPFIQTNAHLFTVLLWSFSAGLFWSMNAHCLRQSETKNTENTKHLQVLCVPKSQFSPITRSNLFWYIYPGDFWYGLFRSKVHVSFTSRWIWVILTAWICKYLSESLDEWHCSIFNSLLKSTTKTTKQTASLTVIGSAE